MTIIEAFKSKSYKRGFEDGVSARVEKLNPMPNEAIQIYYEEYYHRERAKRMVDYVSKKFPDNVVFALPDNVSLHRCSKAVLENMISMLTMLIDELDNDPQKELNNALWQIENSLRMELSSLNKLNKAFDSLNESMKDFSDAAGHLAELNRKLRLEE